MIGLLFVAISVAPEKIFGPEADVEARASAERAFTALGNVFLVSLGALLPHAARPVIAGAAVLALVQIARMGGTTLRRQGGLASWRNLGILSFCIYALELGITLRNAANAGPAEGITYIVLGLYVYALGIAWALLGARPIGKTR